MKALLIQSGIEESTESNDLFKEEDIFLIKNKYAVLESHVVYFSAGESQLKELLIHKTPAFSV